MKLIVRSLYYIRFSSVTDRFFSLVEESCSSKDVSPAVAITYALRYLHLDVLLPSAAFLALSLLIRLSPSRFPHPTSKNKLLPLLSA